jgi:hypothetical protein
MLTWLELGMMDIMISLRVRIVTRETLCLKGLNPLVKKKYFFTNDQSLILIKAYDPLRLPSTHFKVVVEHVRLALHSPCTHKWIKAHPFVIHENKR